MRKGVEGGGAGELDKRGRGMREEIEEEERGDGCGT